MGSDCNNLEVVYLTNKDSVVEPTVRQVYDGPSQNTRVSRNQRLVTTVEMHSKEVSHSSTSSKQKVSPSVLVDTLHQKVFCQFGFDRIVKLFKSILNLQRELY